MNKNNQRTKEEIRLEQEKLRMEQEKLIRILNNSRYLVAIVSIIGGIYAIILNKMLTGIFIILFGITLIPAIYSKLKIFKINEKTKLFFEIILPVVFLVIATFTSPSSNLSQQENANNILTNEVITEEENKMPN